MVQKCPRCGETIAKFPLFREIEGKRVFQWKNLFKIDLQSIILILIVIALVISYKIDTENCMEIVEDPVAYCYESNACNIIEENCYRPLTQEPMIKNGDLLLP